MFNVQNYFHIVECCFVDDGVLVMDFARMKSDDKKKKKEKGKNEETLQLVCSYNLYFIYLCLKMKTKAEVRILKLSHCGFMVADEYLVLIRVTRTVKGNTSTGFNRLQ